MNYTTKPDAYG